MKPLQSLLLLLMLFVTTISFAQAHNLTPGSACKYVKNRCTNMEGCPQCATCTSDDKKEKEAIRAEVQRRYEKERADAKAIRDAEQKAYQDKLNAEIAEAKRQEEARKVVINAQAQAKIAEPSHKEPNVDNAVKEISYTEFYDRNKKLFGIRTYDGDTIFKPQFTDVHIANNKELTQCKFLTLQDNQLNIYDQNVKLIKTVSIPGVGLKFKKECYNTCQVFIETNVGKKTLFESFTFFMTKVFEVVDGTLVDTYNDLWIKGFNYSTKEFNTLLLPPRNGDSEYLKSLHDMRNSILSQGYREDNPKCN